MVSCVESMAANAPAISEIPAAQPTPVVFPTPKIDPVILSLLFYFRIFEKHKTIRSVFFPISPALFQALFFSCLSSFLLYQSISCLL